MSELRTLPWYDRNPESGVGAYLGGLAPHAGTSRLSYTCPKEKIAMVELLSCSIWRTKVDTTPGDVGAHWMLTPKGKTPMMFLYAFLFDNNLGATDTRAIGTTLILLPEDKIEGFTFDLGADGEIMYFLAYKLTLFDAFPIEAPPFQVELPIMDIQEAEAVTDPKM